MEVKGFMEENERKKYLALQAYLLKIHHLTGELIKKYFPELDTPEKSKNDIESSTT